MINGARDILADNAQQIWRAMQPTINLGVNAMFDKMEEVLTESLSDMMREGREFFMMMSLISATVIQLLQLCVRGLGIFIEDLLMQMIWKESKG